MIIQIIGKAFLIYLYLLYFKSQLIFLLRKENFKRNDDQKSV